MKSIFLFVFLTTATILNAQTFDVDTLLYNGSVQNHINLVILGDGYQESDFQKFDNDALNFQNAFFSEEPFKRYKNYFNLFIIKAPSVDSGADHPGTATDVSEPAHPVAVKETYYNSTFDYANIHRLLVSTGTGAIYSVLAQNFPMYDQVIMLVNTSYYGGSGGPIPVSGTDGAATEIALHELGHSFGNLADEYWAGDQFAGERPNMTKETNPGLVKWKNWYGAQNIGIYQHCCGGTSSSWYRPHENCKMRALYQPFCAVCKENIIEQIHALSNPINNFSPVNQNFTAGQQAITFKASLVEPAPNSLHSNWILNGNMLAQNKDSIVVQPADFVNGLNSLSLLVEDTTYLLRINNHTNIHLYSVVWTIQKLTSGIETSGSQVNPIQIQVYPNPASDFLNVLVDNPTSALVSVSLSDESGKIISPVQSSKTVENGITSLSLQLNSMRATILILHIRIGENEVVRKIIRL